MCRSHLTVATLAITLLATAPQHTHAQLVSDVSGAINIQLDPFFGTHPGTLEPTTSQIEVIPIGFDNVSASIDGPGFYSTGGISEINYTYASDAPGEALFDMYSFVESLDGDNGGGGRASIEFDVTVNAPIRYRFQADAIGIVLEYVVAFNGQGANANYDPGTGLFGGSFPPIFHYDNPLPDGWDTYVDEGWLPADTYSIKVFARSFLHQLSAGSTEGTASLHIQLLGDANLDGFVGMEDLNAVLSNWNETTPADTPLIGDLNSDGFIGIEDLNRVLSSWNTDVRPPSAPVPIPEPTSACVLIATGLALTRRGSRVRH